MAWCVVAYREGRLQGMEIFGPYRYRAEAATAAIVIANRDDYDAAYALPLQDPA
jgi:hypothetical protein